MEFRPDETLIATAATQRTEPSAVASAELERLLATQCPSGLKPRTSPTIGAGYWRHRYVIARNSLYGKFVICCCGRYRGNHVFLSTKILTHRSQPARFRGIRLTSSTGASAHIMHPQRGDFWNPEGTVPQGRIGRNHAPLRSKGERQRPRLRP